jgi:hypothetical protein
VISITKVRRTHPGEGFLNVRDFTNPTVAEGPFFPRTWRSADFAAHHFIFPNCMFLQYFTFNSRLQL